ncbi:hypothetical protein [Flavobacterium enshiense]|uniref:Uncharacterized protein n=1 Tax=Flavobacterium enshiense DK69 TaxID=1107311 RepID=A0A0A2MYC8_9FLAO|nr:hypothetical protein [Flavobacterium enshiense]KGO97354.1 hypothetical protein Q767_01790 [Flavobacterium enshiense DK69]
MNKVIDFFKSASPIKIILITFLIGFVSMFLEKPFPNGFLALRLISFMLVVYAIIKFFSKK